MFPQGASKQKYALDLDDIWRSAFFINLNVSELVRGTNTSGTTKQFAPDVGGTGNRLFKDQEILIYSGIRNAFVSSGYRVDQLEHTDTPPPASGIPWQTARRQFEGQDNIILLDPGSLTEIANHEFMPNSGEYWVYFRTTAQLTIDDPNERGVQGLQVWLGDDSFQTSEAVSLYQGPHTINAAGQAVVTWICEGKIPRAHMYDAPLHIRVMAQASTFSGGDIPSARSVVSIVDVRGPGAVEVIPQKGEVIFVDAVTVAVHTPPNDINLYNRWVKVPLNSFIPLTASGIIIRVYLRHIYTGSGSAVTVPVPPSSRLAIRVSGGDNQRLLPVSGLAQWQDYPTVTHVLDATNQPADSPRSAIAYWYSPIFTVNGEIYLEYRIIFGAGATGGPADNLIDFNITLLGYMS